MKKTTLLCLCALLAGLAAPGVSNAAEKRVQPQELRQMFPGQFRAQVRGYDVRLIASRDGSLKGFYGGFSDTGRWSVRGSRLCIMLKDWLDGKTRCAAVKRTGKGTYLAGSIRFRRM